MQPSEKSSSSDDRFLYCKTALLHYRHGTCTSSATIIRPVWKHATALGIDPWQVQVGEGEKTKCCTQAGMGTSKLLKPYIAQRFSKMFIQIYLNRKSDCCFLTFQGEILPFSRKFGLLFSRRHLWSAPPCGRSWLQMKEPTWTWCGRGLANVIIVMWKEKYSNYYMRVRYEGNIWLKKVFSSAAETRNLLNLDFEWSHSSECLWYFMMATLLCLGFRIGEREVSLWHFEAFTQSGRTLAELDVL